MSLDLTPTPDTPASELGILRYRLTTLLAHLAVRQPTDEALCDLQALHAQLDALAAQPGDRWTATNARALCGLISDLRQEIGLLAGRQGRPYRNHLVTGHDVSPELAELVSLGLMVERQRPGFLAPTDRAWRATVAGLDAAGVEHAATLPRLTRGQRRYRRWLSETDASSETFGAWLRRQGRREDDETAHYRSQG